MIEGAVGLDPQDVHIPSCQGCFQEIQSFFVLAEHCMELRSDRGGWERRIFAREVPVNGLRTTGGKRISEALLFCHRPFRSVRELQEGTNRGIVLVTSNSVPISAPAALIRPMRTCCSVQ